ncbi:hypothetical protein L3X38_034431 [Prunus dulcis]|uniref:Uncharacterized protein n=1 Tax=Prunus dulcis TaxID=3755 RepID=A0AAD4YWV3_PRUDU|nr:hypothetical protein L3X38_034431 [Prunus dulcis]
MLAQKFSSLEVELENNTTAAKNWRLHAWNYSFSLKVVKKKSPNSDPNPDERQAQNDWEITAASEKVGRMPRRQYLTSGSS